MLYLIIVLLVVGLVVAFVIAAKKEAKNLDEMLSSLSQEQIDDLKDNRVYNYDPNDFSWTQKGLIGRITDKGNTVALKVVWYNTVIQNNTYNNFQYADIKISKEEFNSRCLQINSIVYIYIDPSTASAKIV